MWGVALMKVIIISMMIDIKGAESWVDPWTLTYDVDGPLKAEVGSSLIIGCSYTFNLNGVFIPDIVSWYKCEGEDECLHSDMIFRSSDVNAGQDEFQGRVFILEQNLTQWKASIVIQQLRVSDTGSYQLKVKGQMQGTRYEYEYEFANKKSIKVTGLAQPMISGGPTGVDVGDDLTLTCEAPSSPPSTVRWTKVGSHIPLETGTERAKLFIPNATRDHAGRYICTANNLTWALSTFADIIVIEKSPAPPRPILEELFSRPGVVAIFISLIALIGVLACIYCLEKTFHGCTSRNYQVLVGNERPCVVMVNQQTGGRLGVDGVYGPEDTQPKALEGFGERGREGEVPDPATTPV